MTFQHSVRYHGHETDIATSVHQSITALHKLAADSPCSVRIVGSSSLPRSGEDTDVSFQAAHTNLSDADNLSPSVVRTELSRRSSFPQALKEALLFQFLEKAGIDKLLRTKICHSGIRLSHLVQDGFQGFR